nr:immunoglobulin light chain junction region [Macaca mulatta]
DYYCQVWDVTDHLVF